MDDFEDERVRRWRADTYRQVSKGITAAVLRTPKAEIDKIRKESLEQNLDFYKLTAARVQGIDYEKVSDADREEAKHALFGHTYGRTI
jgi:hypothetical protein